MVLHLADRLGKLSEEEMITRAPDPSHKQKATYTLTEKSIALVPVLVQLGVWQHLPPGKRGVERARDPKALIFLDREDHLPPLTFLVYHVSGARASPQRRPNSISVWALARMRTPPE
jgi:HxlR-like helix-turn-helix